MNNTNMSTTLLSNLYTLSFFFSQKTYCYIHFIGKETEPQSERAKSFLQVHIVNMWHRPASNLVFIETSCKTNKLDFYVYETYTVQQLSLNFLKVGK